MSGRLPSARFKAVFDSLPPDARQSLIEKQLIPLLNHVDRSQWKKVLAQATDCQARHADMPRLDLRAKRLEVNALLDELHRDSKRSFVKERSLKKELISETVDSLTNWLSDIWRVIYEHNADFMHAHKCILFVAGTLDHMISGRTSCKCAFTNLFVNVTLKTRDGKRVKSWDVSGVQNIEEVLYFLWRELFLCMVASDAKRRTESIQDMLEEIDDLLGWTALERILYGGKKCPHDVDEEEDLGEDDDVFLDEFEEDEDDCAVTDADDVSGGPHPARHWSYRISCAVPAVQGYIQAYLIDVFKQRPSLQLYHTLCIISTDPDKVHNDLCDYLRTAATSSSEMFAAALDIWAYKGQRHDIKVALESHAHLLRPRDAIALQNAVIALAHDWVYIRLARSIAEKELLDTGRALRNALLTSFSQLDAPAHKAELQNILRMRPDAAGRPDRIEAWVDSVSTPGTNAPNPMAFAAMMMGLPLVPGMDSLEDADPLGYFDFDPNDPDMEDLREEFRPKLKQRFEGWVNAAPESAGEPSVLFKVCKEITETMPFLRAGDIVDEMVGRLADKPSKHYVCDALDLMANFVKTQKKRAMGLRHAMRQKEAARQASASPAAVPPAQPVAGPSTAVPPPPLPVVMPLPVMPSLGISFGLQPGHQFGGMEDID